jgi:branched-chain amino acid transport system permease protein
MLETVLIYGLINGVILALVALGFSLTFGVSGIANFAYGALFIFMGYMCWIVLNWLELPYIVAIVFSVLLTILLSLALYKFIIQRVRGMVLSEIIATFAMALVIKETFRYFGFVGPRFFLPRFIDGTVSLAGVPVDIQRILIVAIGLVVVVLLWLFTHYNKTGLAFRAMAQNERCALMLGIDSDRMAMVSLALGGALAAIAALAILPLGHITIESGYDVLLNAVAVSILGGFGSITGLIIAALLLGYIQTFTVVYIAPHWLMVVTLVAIFLVLVVNPSGLLGKQKQLEERI